jgi:hypothetical protein
LEEFTDIGTYIHSHCLRLIRRLDVNVNTVNAHTLVDGDNSGGGGSGGCGGYNDNGDENDIT